MLVKINMHREFAAGRDLMQAAVAEPWVDNKPLDAGDLFHEIDETSGMDRLKIKLGRMTETGKRARSQFLFVHRIVRAEIILFDKIEFIIHQFKENRREETFKNEMRKGLIGPEGGAQFRNLAGDEKRLIQDVIEPNASAADDGVIRLKLSGRGQVALHHVRAIHQKRTFSESTHFTRGRPCER
ncbi:MAG TPA: hypothetical protein VL996_05165 [Methylocella sp.]|nr:hypothetical protein [Methylocella sp.]